jgi:hypothetical protein
VLDLPRDTNEKVLNEGVEYVTTDIKPRLGDCGPHNRLEASTAYVDLIMIRVQR